MIIPDNDIVRKGLSGRVGDKIYRQRRGKTVEYCRSRPYPEKTRLQKNNQSLFGRSAIYARRVNFDKAFKEFHAARAKEHQTAYNAAVSYYRTVLAPLKALDRKPTSRSCLCKKDPPQFQENKLPHWMSTLSTLNFRVSFLSCWPYEGKAPMDFIRAGPAADRSLFCASAKPAMGPGQGVGLW